MSERKRGSAPSGVEGDEKKTKLTESPLQTEDENNCSASLPSSLQPFIVADVERFFGTHHGSSQTAQALRKHGCSASLAALRISAAASVRVTQKGVSVLVWDVVQDVLSRQSESDSVFSDVRACVLSLFDSCDGGRLRSVEGEGLKLYQAVLCSLKFAELTQLDVILQSGFSEASLVAAVPFWQRSFQARSALFQKRISDYRESDVGISGRRTVQFSTFAEMWSVSLVPEMLFLEDTNYDPVQADISHEGLLAISVHDLLYHPHLLQMVSTVTHSILTSFPTLVDKEARDICFVLSGPVGAGKSYMLRHREQKQFLVPPSASPLATDTFQTQLKLMMHATLFGPCAGSSVFRFSVYCRQYLTEALTPHKTSILMEQCIIELEPLVHNLSGIGVAATPKQVQVLDLNVSLEVSALRCLARLNLSNAANSLPFDTVVLEMRRQRSRRAREFPLMQDADWAREHLPGLTVFEVYHDGRLVADFRDSRLCVCEGQERAYEACLVLEDSDVEAVRSLVITPEHQRVHGAALAPFVGKTVENALSTAVFPRRFEQPHTELTFISVNDTHSALDHPPGRDASVGSIERAIAHVDRWRCNNADVDAAAAPVLVFSCGDLCVGTSYFDLFRGKVEASMMKALRVDASTIGNHDIDCGVPLPELLESLGHPIVCANVSLPTTPACYTDYVVLSAGRHRIVVTGVLSPDAWESTHPRYRTQLVFQDPVEVLSTLVPKLRELGDFVVCLSHSGYSYDLGTLAPAGFFDIILGGHTHSHPFEHGAKVVANRLDNGLGGTLVVQAADSLASVARVHLELTGRHVQSHTSAVDPLTHTRVASATGNPAAWAREFRAQHTQALAAVVGHVGFDPTTSTGGGDKTCGPTLAGDKTRGLTLAGYLAADVVRRATGAAIALWPSGGVAAFSFVRDAALTLADVYALTKHDDDELCTCELRGHAVRQLLAVNASRLALRRTLQSAGLRYRVLPHADDAAGTTPTSPRARAVVDIDAYDAQQHTWAPLCDEAWYTVGMPAFVYLREVEPAVDACARRSLRTAHTRGREALLRDLKRTGVLDLPREFSDVVLEATRLP